MDRLLKGFNYFWNKTPSTFTKQDVIFLHAWMKLLKSAAEKTVSINADEPLDDDDLEKIAREIFKRGV